MAELFGKATGVSGGRGGSMHLFDQRARLLGGYGIVGGQIPLATGAALALTYRGDPGPDAEAVMCLLGDGTTNIGAFHESLNLAALWRLPIVYVIVNNRLGHGHAGRARPPPSRTCTSAAAPTASPASGSTATTCSRSATRPGPRCTRARDRAPARPAGGGQLPAARPLGGRSGHVPLPRGDRAAARPGPGPGVPRPG